MVEIHGKGRTVLGWSCGGAKTHLDFSAACLCRFHPVHFFTDFVSDHKSHQDQLDRRPENLQFGGFADVRSPNFVNGMNCHPCLGFTTLDVM